MKITWALALVSSSLCVNTCLADATHEGDHGLEVTLRSVITERHVHVHVHEGIVTLDGKVPTAADRERINSLVRNTTGVVAVKDNLHVTLPEPSAYGSLPARVPVYTTPAPVVVVPPTTIVAPPPPPLVTPDFPKLKVQPSTTDDTPTADRIARQLRAHSLPPTGLEDVTISIASGVVSLRGVVPSQTQHDAIIAAIQRARGVTAIYDQTQITDSKDSDF